MTVTRSVDSEKQLTILTVDGDFPSAAVKKVLTAFYEEHPTKNLLWDFRNAGLGSWSSKDMQAMTNYVKQHGEVRSGGKTAWVVSEDLEFGMMRILETFGSMKKIPFHIKLFRSMNEAVQWLEGDEL